MVEALTDNRNRTVGEIRHLLSKYGGNLGATGCVSYLFEKKGLIQIDGEIDPDAVLEVALEAGAEDVVEREGGVDVITAPADFEAVREALSSAGFEPASAEITMQPTTTVKLEGRDAEAMLKLAEALEDLDDVQRFHANFDISDEELQKFA